MEYELGCPNCYRTVFITEEELPERASDKEEKVCDNCGHIFTFGWYAEVEVR